MNTILSLLIGFMLGILANYSYDRLLLKFRRKKGEYLPKVLDDAVSWTTADGGVYFYEKDPSYNIKIFPGQDSLAERFKKFPDRKHDRISWVEVRFNEAVLFGWNFMRLDGYRFFVPVPKTESDIDGSFYDYYNLNSLEMKVFNIIGSANLLRETSKINGLKSIAQIIGITVTEL